MRRIGVPGRALFGLSWPEIERARRRRSFQLFWPGADSYLVRSRSANSGTASRVRADSALKLTSGARPAQASLGSGDAEMLLRASHEQFRAVVANIPGVVYRCGCDVDWTIRFISEDIADLVGYPASDFIDNRVRRYGSLIYPPDRPRVVVEIDRALEQGAPYSLSYRLVHADGSIRWISEQGRAVLGDNGERAWLDGVILDISERVLAEQARDRAQQALGEQAQLNRYQARHDSLTALPNRVLFGEQVGRAIDAAAGNGSGFALLLIDLDRFKEINDTLGHGAGDAFLTEVAVRMRGVLRAVDSIARLGGDEFACLVPGADAAGLPAGPQGAR